MAQIDIVAAETAFGQHHGDIGGEAACTVTRSIHQHAREPRRQRQLRQLSALRGDAAVGLDRAQAAKQRARLGERRRRRRIKKGELMRIGHSPLREIEQERREIGADDFGSVEGFECGGLRLVPEPIAQAGGEAAGASAPLIRGGARHAQSLEPREPDIRFVALHPCQA
jgi:hypothetical protein